MLIAVEGPDGSGKTSLINRLRESIKSPALYLARSGRFTSLHQLQNFLELVNTAQSIFDYVILDRHPLISEYIYGRILREGGLLGNWKLGELDANLRNLMIIYCDTDFDIIKKTSKDQAQMEGVENNLKRLYLEYSIVMEELRKYTGSRSFGFYNIRQADLDFDAIVRSL